MNKDIQKPLREELNKFKSPVKTEAAPGSEAIDKNEPKDTEEKSISDDLSKKAKYDKIKNLLGNKIFNHAELARGIWGDEDEDTNRSLFKKKLDMAHTDSGGTYEFDDVELSQIGGLLRDTSKAITKTVGRKGN